MIWRWQTMMAIVYDGWWWWSWWLTSMITVITTRGGSNACHIGVGTMWREAAYSEVKRLKLREKLFNVECSEVHKVKWTKQSEVEWGEVKCSMGGGEWVFMEKVYSSSNWWGVKNWGESTSELMIVKKKITKNCTQDSLAWVFLPFVHVVF